MRRFVARHRKALAIAFLGAVEVAAYIIADPGELPEWVITVAALVNVLGVYLAPKNAQPVTSRQDLAGRVGTRAARPEERRPFNGP